VPVGKAQQLWEALQPKNRRKSADSSSSSSSFKPSPEPAFGLDGVDENPSVQYPKLSVGSPFTSQVTDHGRQLDFNFDDSAGITADTPKGPTPMNDFHPDVESERESLASETNNNARVRPYLPARKRFNVVDDGDSSDFPTIEEVYHSQKVSKREKQSPRPIKKTIKEDIERKPMVLDDSSDSDQITPKAPQKQRKLSQSWSKSRTSEKAASQSQASIPRASQSRPSQSQPFVLPPNSQVMDLTISSDAEPERDDQNEESDGAPPNRTLKRYDLSDEDDEDDEDYVDPSDWRPKRNNVRGVETRRQTSVGLRDSSQASLNAQNRRKTTAR
jgi:hypothetical protein